MTDTHSPDGADAQQLLTFFTITPDEEDLFMFSAATWLTHRIHFDREYTKTEGYPNLLVHGPLQGSYLGQMMAELAGEYGGVLEEIEYRHHRPTFCGETLHCQATLTGASEASQSIVLVSDLRIVLSSGEVCTSGSAVIRVPVSDRSRELVDSSVVRR
jgi:3-methylfumaryl-CoA hydratase